MRRPTFLEGVAVALAAAVAGGALFGALITLLAGGPALRLLVTLLSLGYVLYLLGRSGQRLGRVTTLALWIPTAVALWWTAPPLWGFLLAHVGFVWLVRSLYFHASALSALADLGLTGLALAAAVWAAVQTHSFLASVWCFFLVQALFVVIPARTAGGATPGSGRPANTTGADRFQRAHAAAEAAVRRLSQTH